MREFMGSAYTVLAHSKCSINYNQSYAHYHTSCWGHRGARPLPVSDCHASSHPFHLLQPDFLSMRNTPDSFPPGEGKAVPYARNPLSPALGKAGSISPFRPQGKCHLPRKAFPDHPITPRVTVYYIILAISFLAITKNCNDLVSFFPLFIVPLDFKLQKEKSHFCVPPLSRPRHWTSSLRDQHVIRLPLPGGAGKASQIRVHLIRVLEGEQEVTLQGLQR